VTRRLRVLVVDDEPLARSGVRDLVERDPELMVVGECGDGPAAVREIGALEPDLVLLDVQMPGMDGFEVLRAVGPGRMPAVVFITAYDRFALKAFEVSALDYLLKPFDDERFAAALSRAKRVIADNEVKRLAARLIGLLEARDLEPASAPTAFLSRLAVKTSGNIQLIRVDDIDWIEAADYYARIHVGGRAHLIRETMAALESRLDPARFFRVHRSAIVNLERVAQLKPDTRGKHLLVLRDGTRLTLNRSRRERLEERLGQRL
jgi:two-component system, LytTR family, response regulator